MLGAMSKYDLVWLVDDATPVESTDLLTISEVARQVMRDRIDEPGFRSLLETPEALLEDACTNRPRKRWSRRSIRTSRSS
jgi:hypothetical protein